MHKYSIVGMNYNTHTLTNNYNSNTHTHLLNSNSYPNSNTHAYWTLIVIVNINKSLKQQTDSINFQLY